MHGTNIAQTHNAGESTGTLNGNMIVKHFNLNIRSFNAVIPMSDGIDDDLFPNELRVFWRRVKSAIVSESCVLFNLITYKVKGLTHYIKNFPLEHLILDNIHFRADLCFCTVIADKTHSRSWKETLWLFSEKKKRCSAHFFSAIVPNNIVFILLDVFFGGFCITDFLTVFGNKIHINII